MRKKVIRAPLEKESVPSGPTAIGGWRSIIMRDRQIRHGNKKVVSQPSKLKKVADKISRVISSSGRDVRKR